MSFISATAAIGSALHVRTLGAAVLALAVVAGTHTEVRAAADERPDLRIELVGLPLSNTAREVQVRVTNVSIWWATGSKLRVETVSPAAGNVMQKNVENLDPGQSVTFSYTLAAACNGDVVKANVSSAKNYAGVAESNVGNNQIQSEVCKEPEAAPAKPAAATSVRVTDAVSLNPPTASAVVLGQTLDPATSTLAVERTGVSTTTKVVTGPRLGAGGSLAVAYYPPNEQLEEFYVDSTGAINVTWKAQGGRWRPAVALTAQGFAPPGAPLAAVYQPLNEQLEVFVVGVDGAVRGIYKAHNGAWQAPFTLTDAGLAPPGAHLAAAFYPLNNQLEVFVVDRIGRVDVIWKAQNGAWKPAAGLQEGFAPPGAPLAVVYQPLNEQLEVFAVGDDGSVRGIWKAQNSTWKAPFWPAPAGFAPAGANIAGVFYPSNNQLELFVIDRSGTLNVIWKAQNGAWKAPVGLQTDFAAPGAPLAVAYQPLNEQLEVFAVSANGSLHGLSKARNSQWGGQFSLGTGGFAFAKAPITATFYPAQNELAVITTDSVTSSKLAWKLNNGAWGICAASIELGTGTTICDRGPTVAMANGPAAQTARCTALFRKYASNNGWDITYGDPALEKCIKTMGLEKACNDINAFVAVSYDQRYTGDPNNNRRALICSPRSSSDSFGDQFEHLVRGIRQGLTDAVVAAAPFFSMAVQGYACLDGVVFACATLALDIVDAAGADVPGVAHDVLEIARQAPDCVTGDIVACAQLGARGASAAGLSIPGIDPGQVLGDSKQCADGDFAACMRLGKTAAEASGVPAGDLLESTVKAEACADGKTAACVALGKQVAAAAGAGALPLGGLEGGVENAQQCANQSIDACIALGRAVASATGA
jgi:hypothetical protein